MRIIPFDAQYFCLFPKMTKEKGKEAGCFYSSSLCGGKKLEIEGMPIIWGIIKQIVAYD